MKKYLGVIAALSIGAASVGFAISESDTVGHNNVIKVSEMASDTGNGDKTIFSSFFGFFFGSSDTGNGDKTIA